MSELRCSKRLDLRFLRQTASTAPHRPAMPGKRGLNSDGLSTLLVPEGRRKV
jgi:hypothetical protein